MSKERPYDIVPTPEIEPVDDEGCQYCLQAGQEWSLVDRILSSNGGRGGKALTVLFLKGVLPSEALVERTRHEHAIKEQCGVPEQTELTFEEWQEALESLQSSAESAA